MDMNQQLHPGYAQFQRQFRPAAANSSTEDYRSVIDDLTIENKKLKEKLRKYEKLHSAEIEKDKLFEVKIHALPAAKRRDLEDTLRNFASRIEGSLEDVPSNIPKVVDARPPLLHSDGKDRTSQSSDSRPGDSGYASMPNSGPTSTSTHNNRTVDKAPKSTTQATKDQNIESFLKDIPAGLLPTHSVVMTERQKKKLVVKRLEQLFTGKVKGSLACHDQTLQQQEVSNTAAREDHAGRPKSPEEGLREASILPQQADMDILEPARLSNHPSEESMTKDAVLSPEQRPTRPLDLDPDREQIPLDNMEYLHHMGVSTSQMMTEDLSDADSDADGWIFLNLLINMAQLHIMNVTPDFVRSAVADVSAKFQLSKDGQQIRWRGGKEGTRLSSDSDNSSPVGKRPHEEDKLNTEFSSKRQKLGGQFALLPQKPQDSMSTAKEITHNDPFHYKPLFARAESSVSSVYPGVITSRSPISGDSERTEARFGRQHSASSSAKRRTGDGPIAFYSGAKFCTDLSGDHTNIATPLHNTGIAKDGYSNNTDDALGCAPRRPNSLQRTTSGSLLRFRPFKDYSINDPFRMSKPQSFSLVGKDESDEEGVLNMNMEWSSDEVPPIPLLELSACGLGGTHPADHFVYTVRTKRTRRGTPSPKKLRKAFLNRTMSNTIIELFKERQNTDDITTGMASMSTFNTQHQQSNFANRPIHTEILDVKYTKLRPSQLPEPFTYFEAMSTTSDDSSSDSSSSSSGISKYRRPLPNNHWQLDLPDVVAETSGEVSDDEEEEESDSSVDMLADLRAVNPAVVRAQEADFAMEIDGGGSSAATVGGRTESESSDVEDDEDSEGEGEESEGISE